MGGRETVRARAAARARGTSKRGADPMGASGGVVCACLRDGPVLLDRGHKDRRIVTSSGRLSSAPVTHIVPNAHLRISPVRWMKPPVRLHVMKHLVFSALYLYLNQGWMRRKGFTKSESLSVVSWCGGESTRRDRHRRRDTSVVETP